ncbi:hypothetical protein BN1182_CJ_01180 [Pantoea ananatis]|nr:hypothetical protein BN1182_CJ_01180 [Pantoea ananatis]
MNATDTFFSIMLARFIYQNDRLSDNKSPGSPLGFSGVMLVNFESRLSDFQFSGRVTALWCWPRFSSLPPRDRENAFLTLSIRG